MVSDPASIPMWAQKTLSHKVGPNENVRDLSGVECVAQI